MKGKTYKVDLLPEDFINSNFINAWACPLALAAKRYFKVSDLATDCNILDIYGPVRKKFEIVNEFLHSDYLFVKEQYENPDYDTIYFVELKEIK